jgi:hypothetical protein
VTSDTQTEGDTCMGSHAWTCEVGSDQAVGRDQRMTAGDEHPTEEGPGMARLARVDQTRRKAENRGCRKDHRDGEG